MVRKDQIDAVVAAWEKVWLVSKPKICILSAQGGNIISLDHVKFKFS